jgi:hypothetical protein
VHVVRPASPIVVAAAPPGSAVSLPPPQPAATTIGEAGLTTCTNEAAGYEIGYPEGWETNTVGQPCTLFDPESFEVVTGTEAPPVAVRVDREPVPYEQVVAEQPSRRVLTRTDTSIAGRQAVVHEYETTGAGLLPGGIRGYEYVVDLGDSSFIAVALAHEGNDYARNKRVLDRMMGSFRLIR